MSHVFPEVGEVELSEYVRDCVDRIQRDLDDGLKGASCDDKSAMRYRAAVRAYGVCHLVCYFNLTMHPDFSTKLADLMVNSIFS